jgi:hypothetical protein
MPSNPWSGKSGWNIKGIRDVAELRPSQPGAAQPVRAIAPATPQAPLPRATGPVDTDHNPLIEGTMHNSNDNDDADYSALGFSGSVLSVLLKQRDIRVAKPELLGICLAELKKRQHESPPSIIARRAFALGSALLDHEDGKPATLANNSSAQHSGGFRMSLADCFFSSTAQVDDARIARLADDFFHKRLGGRPAPTQAEIQAAGNAFFSNNTGVDDDRIDTASRLAIARYSNKAISPNDVMSRADEEQCRELLRRAGKALEALPPEAGTTRSRLSKHVADLDKMLDSQLRPSANFLNSVRHLVDMAEQAARLHAAPF